MMYGIETSMFPNNRNNNFQIHFKRMQAEDLTLLHQWFQIPHVLQWYAREKMYSLQEIQEKYLPRLNDATIVSYIIYNQDKPVGYIQLYLVKYHFPEGIKNSNHVVFNTFQADELAGIDLFIADSAYLHTSFAGDALSIFISQAMTNQFQAILVDPVKNNARAIKFFEKNGFTHIISQDEKHDLMIKDLRPSV